MSSFKRRPQKVIKKNDQSFKTLDIKHQEKMLYFEQKDDDLPKIKDVLVKTKRKLQLLENTDPSLYTTDDVRNRALYKSQIEQLTNEISKIENNTDEQEYILETIDILVDYYNYMDTHMDIDKKFEENPSIFQKYKQLSRANLLDQYNSLVGDNYKKNKRSPIRICKKCGTEKTLNLTEGIYVCIDCGETELVTMDSDQPNYKDPLPDNQTYAYQRKNHFILGDGNSKLLSKCRVYGKENCAPSTIFVSMNLILSY
jgi:hypothetical protein